MTQPALLDSIIAWPVVERRFLDLGGGQNRLLLHNRSPKPAPVLLPELGKESAPKIRALDGLGSPAAMTREFDRKRRRYFYLMPPGGTAVVEWAAARNTPNNSNSLETKRSDQVSKENETNSND